MQGGEVWRGFKEEGLEQELEDGIVPKSPGTGETGCSSSAPASVSPSEPGMGTGWRGC